MHPAFQLVDHRPWPLPATRWNWRQTWCDLLFAHWPISSALVRPLVPHFLEIDEFDGTSWVGLVPFRMEGVMRRGWPDVPGLSAFPEMNLRLYVRYEDRPGVWFISLDATKKLAVWGARRFFHLPYFLAAMSLRIKPTALGNQIDYFSQRKDNQAMIFRGCYGPVSEVYRSQPGSLEHFLTERYCLYAPRPDGGLNRVEVHHLPWPLQQATVSIAENRIGEMQGIPLDGPPALVHYSRRLEVVVYPAEKLHVSRQD